MKILIDKHFSHKNITYFIKIFKLHKSFLLFLSDHKDLGIGSVFLSSPSTIEGVKTSSTNIFGIKEKLLGQILVEKAANSLKSPVMLILFITSDIKEEEIIKPILVVLNEILEEIEETEL
jgi:hypothetical protein